MASFTLVEGFRELIQAPACPQSLFVHAPANVDLVGGWLVMAVKQLRASALVVSLDLTELSTPKAVCERVVCECEAASSRTASQRAGQDSATLDGMFGILRQTGHHRDEGSGQTFLVFEHAEKCSAWDDGRFLAAMLAIGELSDSRVHALFVSAMEWGKIRPRGAGAEPQTLAASAPSSAETYATWLTRQRVPMSPEVLPDPDRLAFAEYVCEAFASHTAHEAVELESLVQRLLPRWQEIARDSCFSPRDRSKMVTHLRPLVQAELARHGSLRWHLPPRRSSAGARRPTMATTSSRKPRATARPPDADDQLPSVLSTLAKRILLAAYIASYNPQSSDLRLLGTEEGRKRARAARKRVLKPGQVLKRRDRQSLVGPRQFTLERLSAILTRMDVQHGTEADRASAAHQTRSLIRAQLLAQTTAMTGAGADRLDGIKLRCAISAAVADMLADEMGFDLAGYLWELPDQ